MMVYPSSPLKREEEVKPSSIRQVATFIPPISAKGSVKNNLVEFAPEFAVDLIDLIEQNRRNSELF